MRDPIVLCYHALSPTWTADLSTTPERFERQIALLVKRGYRGVTFTQAVRAAGAAEPAGASGDPQAVATTMAAGATGDGGEPRSGPSSRERVVAITFDDAYRSVIELAKPILDRYGLVATVFASTDFIDSGQPMRWSGIDRWLSGPDERELTPMSWAQLRALAQAGWEVGSHTCSHPHLTQIDEDALTDELARSKAVCERHMDDPCTSVAYPYGDVDARVVAATARAGYSVGATLPARLSLRGALEWPRIGVYRGDHDVRFRLKVSPAVMRLRRSALWVLRRRPPS